MEELEPNRPLVEVAVTTPHYRTYHFSRVFKNVPLLGGQCYEMRCLRGPTVCLRVEGATPTHIDIDYRHRDPDFPSPAATFYPIGSSANIYMTHVSTEKDEDVDRVYPNVCDLPIGNYVFNGLSMLGAAGILSGIYSSPDILIDGVRARPFYRLRSELIVTIYVSEQEPPPFITVYQINQGTQIRDSDSIWVDRYLSGYRSSSPGEWCELPLWKGV